MYSEDVKSTRRITKKLMGSSKIYIRVVLRKIRLKGYKRDKVGLTLLSIRKYSFRGKYYEGQ